MHSLEFTRYRLNISFETDSKEVRKYIANESLRVSHLEIGDKRLSTLLLRNKVGNRISHFRRCSLLTLNDSNYIRSNLQI